MKDAQVRLTSFLDLVEKMGRRVMILLYQIRDLVADGLQLPRLIRLFPWLFSSILAPDMISISRLLAALSLLIWHPPLYSSHVMAVIIWSGLSDWLDGYIAKQARAANLPLWGLQRHWKIATGNAVDSAADGLTLLLATIYLAVFYPNPATIGLLAAVGLELVKIPVAIHGYLLVKQCSPDQTRISGIIRKERIGEAKMLCLFLAVILTWTGIVTQSLLLLFLATTLTGFAMGLCYLATARYVRRFLGEFPDLLARWHSLPRPLWTWWLVMIFAKRDIAKQFPPPKN